MELSRLAGGLAHEIRNPLSTVNLNLQLLEEDLDEAAKQDDALRRSRRRVDIVRKEVKRLSDALEDFLRFVRLPAPRCRPDDVNDILREATAFIRPQADRARVGVLAGLGDVPVCRVDRDLLKQALLNLFLNALQAMPNGGQLMVRSAREGDMVSITVADTGHGIAPEVRQRVFEPYFSTKRGGTGLGLPMVKRIVEEHGGRLVLHSELDKGTSVTLFLPVSGPVRPATEGIPATPAP